MCAFKCALCTALFAVHAFADLAEETELAFELESRADMVVYYSADGKLDIGVCDESDVEPEVWIELQKKWSGDDSAKVENTKPYLPPVFFDFEQLREFFRFQRHKRLIVVIFHKRMWDETIPDHVEKVRKFFHDAGYKRICIQQALGVGRGIYLDTGLKKPQTDTGTKPLKP